MYGVDFLHDDNFSSLSEKINAPIYTHLQVSNDDIDSFSLSYDENCSLTAFECVLLLQLVELYTELFRVRM